MIGLFATISLLVWLYMFAGHGQFWSTRETDDEPVDVPESWPMVVAIVPARDEATVIGRSIASLLMQDYPGEFRIILVDDGSSDGTASIAETAAAAAGSSRLRIVSGAPLPTGWTGKLWAVAQGVDQAPAEATWLWLTDADIVHAPDTLRLLVARAIADKLVLNSSMALLRCESLAERALIPAFVFFFKMLYPFARVNDPSAKLAAAAGGCMLVDRAALARAGGIAVIADAIIDDCAMGAAMKKQGPIRLQLTHRSVSIRTYGDWQDIGAMVSRSAYAQLRYSPLLLGGTLAGMGIIYLLPPLLALFGGGLPWFDGLMAWAIMAVLFQPMLLHYRRSPLWGIAMPAIAGFYTWATIMSAVHYRQGRGGMWKGRAQARMPK
jgi:hopene-associated glycosyltransferase HpnB